MIAHKPHFARGMGESTRKGPQALSHAMGHASCDPVCRPTP